MTFGGGIFRRTMVPTQQDVSSWPFCEVFAGAFNARLLRTCGPELLDASYSQFDPLQT